MVVVVVVVVMVVVVVVMVVVVMAVVAGVYERGEGPFTKIRMKISSFLSWKRQESDQCPRWEQIRDGGSDMAK